MYIIVAILLFVLYAALYRVDRDVGALFTRVWSRAAVLTAAGALLILGVGL